MLANYRPQLPVILEMNIKKNKFCIHFYNKKTCAKMEANVFVPNI